MLRLGVETGIGNRRTKTRGHRDGEGATKAKTFNTVLLSSGEHSFEDMMRRAKLDYDAGEVIRFSSLPAQNPDYEYDSLQDIKGQKNGEAFVKLLKENSHRFYGTAIYRFLHWLAEKNNATFRTQLRQRIKEYTADIVPADSVGQVSRMVNKFALLSLAGELAIEAGILPFEKGTCLKNEKVMFKEWLKLRGSTGNHETITGVESLHITISKHEKRFQDIHGDEKDKPQNRLGFFEDYNRGGIEYRDYIVETKRINDVITEGSPRETIKQLKTDGIVVKHNAGKNYKTMSLPGLHGRPSAYIFTFKRSDPVFEEIEKLNKRRNAT